jgi:hypothetical protein
MNQLLTNGAADSWRCPSEDKQLASRSAPEGIAGELGEGRLRQENLREYYYRLNLSYAMTMPCPRAFLRGRAIK